MFAGVSKSGSPISRWMTSTPVASIWRARASTSNAVSVPSRLIALASFMAMSSLTLPSRQREEHELRDRNPAGAPNGSVLETGGRHRLGVVQVASVDQHGPVHSAAEPPEIELLELVPF